MVPDFQCLNVILRTIQHVHVLQLNRGLSENADLLTYKILTVNCILFGLVFFSSFQTIMWLLIISLFKCWKSLSFYFCVSLYITYSVINCILWTPASLTRGVWRIQQRLSNIWRKIQIVDRAALLSTCFWGFFFPFEWKLSSFLLQIPHIHWILLWLNTLLWI